MNTEMLSPELQLNNMLEQINAQLPNNKAQKVSEIMNSVLGGEMLLRHVGFYKALSGVGEKIGNIYKDVSSGESSLADSVVNNIVPDALQPLARGVTSALTGGGTQDLVNAATDALPENLQSAARGVTTALTGGGTEDLASAVSGAVGDAVAPLAQTVGGAVERAVAPVSEEASGVLDRVASSLRSLGGRVSSALRGPRGPITDESLYNLDDPAMNADAPLMFDSGQNIGNAFAQAQAQAGGDAAREVSQASQIQEQQAAANKAFNSDEPEETPDTQAGEVASGEENIASTAAQEGEGLVSEATQVGEQVASTAAKVGEGVANTVSKVSADLAETGGFEFGPLFEGAAILASVVTPLVSLFEKPEIQTATYVGDQTGL